MNFERYMASMRVQQQLAEGQEVIARQGKRNQLLKAKLLKNFPVKPQEVHITTCDRERSPA